MKCKNLLAKALFDNVPETPEELAFRKGDILTVIEQNTGGLEGWWLCSLHGRQGIAPGNRLNLLLGPMFEGNMAGSLTPPHSLAHQQSTHTSQGIYQVPSTQGQAPPIYQIPPTLDVYQVPQRSTLAVDVMPSRVNDIPPSTQRGRSSHGQSLYDTPPSQDVRHQGVYNTSASQDVRHQGVYDTPPSQDVRHQGVYDTPPSQDVRHQGVYDTPASQDVRHQGVYDTPASQDIRHQRVYDTPPQSQGVCSTAPCWSTAAQDEGDYDFPQPHKQKPEGVYDVPPAFMSKSTQSNYDFPPSSEACVASGNISSVYDIPASQLTAATQDLYDVPRGMQARQCERERVRGVDALPAPDSHALTDVTDGVNRLSFSSARGSVSTSSMLGSAAEPAPHLDSALRRLGRLQLGLISSVSTLQGLAASPCCRKAGSLERQAGEVRGALGRVHTTLADLLTFGKEVVATAPTLSDPPLQAKLCRQLQRLEDAQKTLQQTHRSLESSGWSPAQLDRVVMVSRTLPDDARQLASTVGGSAELLFRRTPVEGIVHPFTCAPPEENSSCQTKPFPVVQDSEKCVKSWMEDYDYVHLQGKEEFERQQRELLEKENIVKLSRTHLGQDQLNQFKKLEQEVIKPVENDITQWISHQHSTGSSSPSDSSSTSSVGGGAHLCGRDRQLLTFYAEQCEQHFVSLLNAVDAFFGCVAAAQPPRIFVAHAKFVILSAHKLVFIGDTLSRQVSSPDVSGRVTDSSNVLCELLKTMVSSTKMAALRYPNTAAVQDMVHRVTHLSHQAQHFKMQLLHMATF
ncbi:enhancer of filamentation 1 [Brachyhypopomus gauderio]|uniref:enhancer of filamentation 1 n=1 Tax=Brachyhypopomus gauderio TaxID=698409 RepID=UPI004040FFB2